MPYRSSDGFTAWSAVRKTLFLEISKPHVCHSPERDGEACGDCTYPESKQNKNVALIQPTNTDNDFHLRYVGKDIVSLTYHLCMLMVMLVRADNTPAMTGSYFV